MVERTIKSLSNDLIESIKMNQMGRTNQSSNQYITNKAESFDSPFLSRGLDTQIRRKH